MLFEVQCNILSFLSIFEPWFNLLSFLSLHKSLYVKYCLQQMYVLGALRGETIYIWGKWHLKDNKWLKTQTQELAEVLMDTIFCFCDISITLNEIFFKIFFFFNGRAKLLLGNKSVQFFTWHYLFWKLAKIYWGDGLFVPWLACC